MLGLFSPADLAEERLRVRLVRRHFCIGQRPASDVRLAGFESERADGLAFLLHDDGRSQNRDAIIPLLVLDDVMPTYKQPLCCLR